MVEHLGIKKIPHYKKFDLTTFVNQLAFRLYADNHVRTFRQGLHYIKLGVVKVDGWVEKDPFSIVKPGSTLFVDISLYKKTHTSMLWALSQQSHLETVHPKTQKILPRTLGKNKKNLKLIYEALQN